VSTVTVDQVLQYVAPRLDGPGYDRGDVKNSTIEHETTIQGDGVPIWWQETDREVLERAASMTPTPSSSPSSVAESPSSGTSSGLPENTSSSNQNSQDQSLHASGLSTGAKIGLGVGIPLAGLLGLAPGYMVFRRRMLRRTNNGGAEVVNAEGYAPAGVTGGGEGRS
jgi:hypothetical protein